MGNFNVQSDIAFINEGVTILTASRKNQPSMDEGDGSTFTKLFVDFEFKLNPTFEPESENPDKENTEKFALLQKYNRVNLVVPVDAPHMYHAAMNSKSCKLTVVGEYYWQLVKEKRI